MFYLGQNSLLAAGFFFKGHLDECLVIVNAKEQYGGVRVGRRCLPRPCLVPFSFRLNVERKTDYQQFMD